MRGPRRGSAFRVPRRLHLGPRRGVPRAATRASNFQRSTGARVCRRALGIYESTIFRAVGPENAPSLPRAVSPTYAQSRPRARARAPSTVALVASSFSSSGHLQTSASPRAARTSTTTARPASPSSSTVLRPPRLRSPCLGSSSTRTPRACSSPGRPSATPADSCRASTRETPSRTPSSPSTAPSCAPPRAEFPPIRPRRRTGRRTTTTTPRARRNLSSPARFPSRAPASVSRDAPPAAAP